MATLLWDQIGQRYYEGGVDKGVLYMPDGRGISWSGLISVTEKVSGGEGSPIYFDGVKYANVQALGEFTASLKAYTYPEEFGEFEGTLEVGNGLFVTNQFSNRFGLSYRTKIGNDTDGDNLGYKIHVVYNLSAVASQKNYETFNEGTNPVEFEWSLSAIPGEVPGFQPTAHLIFDSRYMGELVLKDIEDTLYGDELNDARLPPISVLTGFIENWVIIRIIDNLDGTWTAIGPSNLITMLDSTTFQITQANATYIDADTYMIGDLTY